jgi:signal transduction histidine kinase
MKILKRLIPDSAAGRTFSVMLIGLAVSHVLSIALYSTDRLGALAFIGGEHLGERIATISRLVENLPKTERSRIVELAASPTLDVRWAKESAVVTAAGGGWRTRILRDALLEQFTDLPERTFRMMYAESGSAQSVYRVGAGRKGGSVGDQGRARMFLVSLKLPDGSWLNFRAPLGELDSFWTYRFGLSMLVMIAAVFVLTAMVVFHITAPLRVLAKAAHRLGTDVHAPPLKVSGPVEVRRASQAFNEMQQRIRRFVEDRTQMIAAISHDLSTPITRLRLRAEFIDDEDERRKTLVDLDDMERMIDSTLAFTRDDAAQEPRETVDLAALVQSVRDNLVDIGMAVAFDADGRLPYSCRPTALRRALTNLMENAAKYGGQARVSLLNRAESLVVRIDDDGPGIPEPDLETVFKPFRRLEDSRSRETGGTGLGLTVARSIVRAHGGEIALTNRPEGGLRVDVTLPL